MQLESRAPYTRHKLLAEHGLEATKRPQSAPSLKGAREPFTSARVSLELLHRIKTKHPLLKVKELGDPSLMRNPMKDSDSLHSLTMNVAPHHVSQQVGASLDAGGSWRNYEPREIRLSRGVHERNLLSTKDLHGQPINPPLVLLERSTPPRTRSASRLSTTRSATISSQGMFSPQPTPFSPASLPYPNRPSSAASTASVGAEIPASAIFHAERGGDIRPPPVSPGMFLAMGLRPSHSVARW